MTIKYKSKLDVPPVAMDVIEDAQPQDIMGEPPSGDCELENWYESRAYFDSPLVRGLWCSVHEHWFFMQLDRRMDLR